MDSARRRYLNLLARARDQAGTPEAKVCAEMADRMLARRPELADADADDLPHVAIEYRYKEAYEYELLVRLGKYLDLDAKVWTRSRKKVIVYITDEPTHAAIEHTYEVLRARLADVLLYAYTGFAVGALPLPRSPRDDDDDDDVDELDESLAEMAIAAQRFGSGSHPRKALTRGK